MSREFQNTACRACLSSTGPEEPSLRLGRSTATTEFHAEQVFAEREDLPGVESRES
jgi:hypothetical protein